MHSGCKHYDPISRYAGTCAIGMYEGKRISAGVCLLDCKVFDGSPELRRAFRQRVRLTVAGWDVRTQTPPVRVHRWLGLEWIGKPWPQRLRLMRRWPFVRVEDAPGCGCIMRLKMLTQRIFKPKKKKGTGCGCQGKTST